MPIQTERLSLRPLNAGDGPLIFEAVEESRELLERWLPWPQYVKSWEDSEKFAREQYAYFILRQSLTLGIFQGDHFIGVCGFHRIQWKIPSAEIGYWCRQSAQGWGYMQEAVQALVAYGFKDIGLKRLEILCFDDNKPSAALAEKLGFNLETRALGLMDNFRGDDLVLSRLYAKTLES